MRQESPPPGHSWGRVGVAPKRASSPPSALYVHTHTYPYAHTWQCTLPLPSLSLLSSVSTMWGISLLLSQLLFLVVSVFSQPTSSTVLRGCLPGRLAHSGLSGLALLRV